LTVAGSAVPGLDLVVVAVPTDLPEAPGRLRFFFAMLVFVCRILD